MITTEHVEIDVWKPTDRNPTFTIPGDDIASFEYSERAGTRKDSGTISLHNDYGEYVDEVTSGDRIDVYIRHSIPEDDEYAVWGEDTWASGIWGGEDAHRLVWSGLVRPETVERESFADATLDLDVEDFAFGVLAKRRLYAAFRDDTIRSILRDITEEVAPEIRLAFSTGDGAGVLDERTTVAFDGTNAFDAMRDLLARTELVARAYGDLIYIEPFEAPSPKFELAWDDVGAISRQRQDDGTANVIRVDGARGTAIDQEASHPFADGWVTLDAGERHSFRISTKKAEVASVELWLEEASEATFTVRLQPGDDRGPDDPSDQSTDIARNEQDHEFVSQDDWCEFIMPGHTLPEPDPWVIMEVGDGEDSDGGHRFAVDEAGEVTRQIYYSYPITVEERDLESIREFRQRDAQLGLDDADTEQARDRVRSELARRALPELVFEFDVESRRTLALRPGELIDIDFPRDGIDGTFIVTERSESYENHEITATVTVQDITTVGASDTTTDTGGSA